MNVQGQLGWEIWKLYKTAVLNSAFFLNFILLLMFLLRYISKEILTIREAVWLTDNTYQYEDLVRMMGEVISVLEGKIRVSDFRTVNSVYLSSPQQQRFLSIRPGTFVLEKATALKHKVFEDSLVRHCVDSRFLHSAYTQYYCLIVPCRVLYG